MSGKGDNRRRENRAAVDHNWGEIDWNARERDAEAHLFLGEQVVAVEHDTPLSNDFYRRMVDFGVIAVDTRETPDVSPTTYAELDAGPVLHFSRSVLPRATWWRRLWWRVCDAFTRPCMDP